MMVFVYFNYSYISEQPLNIFLSLVIMLNVLESIITLPELAKVPLRLLAHVYERAIVPLSL